MNKETKLMSDFEQAETALTTIAMMVASFYWGLVENRVPHELAAELTMTYNEMHLSVILGGKDE